MTKLLLDGALALLAGASELILLTFLLVFSLLGVMAFLITLIGWLAT